MGMHQGIDLSRFKKVGGDKKTTVMRHTNGHEIKIAHAGLTPKMREQLNALPVHMADGGEAPEPMDDESPAGAEDAPAETPSADITAEPYGDPQKPWADQDSGIPPPPEHSEDDDQGEPDVVVTGERKGQANPQAMQAPETAQERDAHDAMFYQDLKNGHITPETYQSLFDKKDTLGKIGTLFGLLISGAGSGLAHQPNMVLEMMNKQIQNDLDAQKATKENTKNFYQLSLQHELQKVQVPLMQAQAKLAEAQAAKVPSEIAQAEAQVKHLNAQAEFAATNSALNRMKIAAYNELGGQLGKASPATQAAAAPAYQAMGTAVQTTNGQRNAQTAAATAPPPAPPSSPTPQQGQAIDWGKFDLIKQHGQMSESLGMPGGMRAADVGKATDEAGRSQAISNVATKYDGAFRALDKLALAGKLNKQEYDAQTAILKPEIAKMLVGGQFSQKEADDIANGMWPDFKDWGGARGDKYTNTMGMLADQYNNTPTLDSFHAAGLKAPWPKYVAPGSKASKAETGPTKTVGGKTYRRGPNGEAILVTP